MKMIEKFINMINIKFFPKGGPTDESLFNNVLAWTFLSTSIVIIIITILKYSKIVIFTILAGAALLLLIYLLSSHFNQQRLGSIILVVTVNFVSLPLLFFMLGAATGGIASLFILGIVLTIVLINGIVLYILVPLEVVYYGLVYWFAYNHPEYITNFTVKSEIFRSSFMYMLIAAVLIGCIAKILFAEYQKENKRVNELLIQVRELSMKDPLTSVYNRRYMMEYLEEYMQKSKVDKTPLSIILFDIDKFKEINDTYGHVVGDEVLQKIAQIFLQYCRKGDIVARYGGEEFLIILPNTDIEIAVKRADEIRVSVNQELNITQIIDPVSISGGIAQYLYNYELKEFIREADKKLYAAKSSGRNRIVK